MNFDPVWLIALSAGLGLMPIFLMMATCYVKIVTVIMLVRNALGVQQIPPQMVINGLAMVMTVFIMAPVASDTMDLLAKENVDNLKPVEVFQVAERVSPPLKQFLVRNTDERVSNMFVATAKRIWPERMRESVHKGNWAVLLPSFTITELTKAFQIGFVLYLAFIAIDLIISNILLAMGMMMVSPTTISLPFKLLLFVTLDGWLKITQGLMLSYQ
ncbi:MAG: type III secretion system export apparatus subunit SctR [Duodenibacillus sp.]|nr:type III secretion system export apparatus subunit SctR [Duodenibacillus sp.]